MLDHARRKFADIVKSGVSDLESKRYAQEAIILIQKLYKIEREIKDDPPDKKLLIRKEEISSYHQHHKRMD
ncbi:MAG: transposase [Sulfurovum sp.]|nr:transposase [Sulfurovum sp.]